MSNGMGSHQSRNMITDVWLTPPTIITALGPFDLDPCAQKERVFETANFYFSKEDDGLTKEWNGFVWMNPPYGSECSKWLEKLSNHNNGIALIFARTETKSFQKFVWEKASSLLFIYNRLTFYTENGTLGKSNSGAPSVLVGYGSKADERLKKCGIPGKFLQLNNEEHNA